LLIVDKCTIIFALTGRRLAVYFGCVRRRIGRRFCRVRLGV